MAAASTTASITITGVVKGVPPPVAAFTAVPSSGPYPLPVTFTDTSTGGPIDSWAWDFGDNTPISTVQNPVHTYITAGTYTAKLTVTKGTLSSTATKDIIVYPPLTAAFTATQDCTTKLKVKFMSTYAGGPPSGPTTWLWDFGDLTSSTVQNPIHTYATAGTYTVKLTVTRGAESITVSKTIKPGTLTASFSASATSGTAPLYVSFTDTSTGIPTSWKWEVKKGSGSYSTFSTDQNPSYNFETSGTYTVKLTPGSSCGSCTAATKTITVNPVLPAPTVSSITPASGNRGWPVSITNLAGTGFQSGATVKLKRTGYPDILGTGVTVVSSTKITCTFDLKDKTIGKWNVVVTNPDNKVGTLTDGFEIKAPAPTVSSITPASGNRGWTVLISNLAGTGFQPGATVKLTRTGSSDILGTSVTVVSSTKITCSFDLISATAGSWNVVVTNPDTQSASKSAFTVISNAPTISGSFTPASGARGNTVTITSIPGTNFQPGATVVLTSANSPTTTITATVTSITSTKITASAVIPSTATTGYYTAKVTNTDGKYGTKTSAFKVT